MSKRFSDWKVPAFDRNGVTRWQWMCQHQENLKLGKYVDIGAFSYINAKAGVIMEDCVQIGSHVSIYSVSTIDNKVGQVVLKKNVRIGTHSVVMPGVTIGENSIVGAFSFVNENIPPNVLVYGVPARIIRGLTPQDVAVADA
jgi:acetyltransferase-like isoleucine patch superfamily enzyme